MSDRVLITGASGFLGYHIIEAALEGGLTVYAAVRKSSRIEHLEKLPIHYLFLDFDNEADIADQLLTHQINFIIHAAGDTKAATQQAYDHINATYTLNLAKAAQKSGLVKKIVFISSLAAVGPLSTTGAQLTESSPANPVTAYGRSKLLAEKYLTEQNIPVTIFIILSGK